MARFENGNISGAIGNIVFYTMDGKNYVKAKPATGKRKKTQPRSPQVQSFSDASIYGTSVINWLKPHLAFTFKRITYNAFRSWLNFSIRQHQSESTWPLSVAGTLLYNINRESEIRDILLVLPSITSDETGNISIQFPSFIPVNQIKAPNGTTEVQLKLIAVSNPFSNAVKICSVKSELYIFSYDKNMLSENEIIIATNAKTGYMLFVIIAITFKGRRGGASILITDTKWLPAAIMAAGKL